LRIDEELAAKITAIADSEKRSFNSEVAYILQCFVQQYEAKNGVVPVSVPAPEE
jgi:hypothetical protein